MELLVKNLIENDKNTKIQKPDCSSRVGRSLLAFYLKTKLKQLILLWEFVKNVAIHG